MITFSKTKKKLVAYQIFDCIFNGLSSLALGGISGLVVNIMALFRNSLVYLNLTGIPLATVYSLILYCITYKTSYSSIDWLSALSSVMYCYVICLSNSVTRTKIALVLNQVGWFAFNLHIQAYPALATNVILSLTSVYSIITQSLNFADNNLTPFQRVLLKYMIIWRK